MARIALFLDGHGPPGGAERGAVELASGLARQGHEPTLIHFGDPWLEETCRARSLDTALAPLVEAYHSRWLQAAFVWRFAALLRTLHIDLLQTHRLSSLTLGAITALMAGVPHVGVLHDAHRLTDAAEGLRRLRFAARISSTLVMVSEATRAAYRRALPKLGFECVRYGLPVPLQPRARRRPGPLRFLAATRLMAGRGHELLLSAAARVSGQAEFELSIAGTGPLHESLLRQASSLGMGDRVKLIGFQEDLHPYLAEADAFVCASPADGVSYGILEAMAAGLPSLAVQTNANRELVEHGVSGFLVRPDDAEGMARHMVELARDTERARLMGEAARARVELRFSLDGMLQGYGEIYRSLLPAAAWARA